MSAMPDGNTAALDRHMADEDRSEAVYDALRADAIDNLANRFVDNRSIWWEYFIDCFASMSEREQSEFFLSRTLRRENESLNAMLSRIEERAEQDYINQHLDAEIERLAIDAPKEVF